MKNTVKRIISLTLVFAMLLTVVPALAFEDEGAPVPSFQHVEAPYTSTENKYFYFSEYPEYFPLTEGKLNQANDADVLFPMIPDGRGFMFEFVIEQTQEIRLELWDETGTQYLGLLGVGLCEGQWGIIHGEQWYNRTTGEGAEKPISNRLVWDGLYWDTAQKTFLRPGIDALDWDGEQKEFNFIVRFQPTDPATQQYTNDLTIWIDYSDDAVAKNAQLRALLYEKLGLSPDPVYMPTGNFLWDYTDFSVYGAQPLEFSRHYNAQDERDGELGYGWRHSYMYELEISPLFATVHMANGYRFSYSIKRDGSFEGSEGNLYTLEAVGADYIFTSPDKTRYTFNADGYLTAIEDVSGNRTDISRNGAEIFSVSNSSGTLTFNYSSGKTNSITDHTGRSVTYTYDGNGDLVSFMNADNDTINYTYESHRITSISDFNGNTYVRNTYDELGRVTEQYLADQGTSYFEYDFTNRVSTLTDPQGAVKKYYYDINLNITALEDINGQVRYEYANGLMTKATDRLGNSISYAYDSAGNMTSITYPDGTFENYEYNDLNLVTRQTNKDGTAIRYEYDGRGNLTAYTDAKGNTSRFTYDANNNMLSSTDPLGNTSSYTYDDKGNTLTQTDPLGNVTSFEYDVQGRLAKQTNADGGTVEYEYSTAGKLIKTTDPAGNVQTYSVTGNGFDDGSTDPMGFSTTTIYNEQNKPISVTDSEGNTTTYSYDSVGNMVSTTDSLGNTVRYAYDLAGRIVSMTDARGNTTTFNYDSEGRMIGVTDALSNSTSSHYDSMGRATSGTNARGATSSYTYDVQGRTVGATDALGNFTRNVYDVNGSLIEQYDKNGNRWAYTYDANNRMVEAIDPLGYRTTYTYDGNGQATKTVSALGNQTQFVYDSMGRIVKSIDPEGYETSYEYDFLGRLVKSVNADGTFTANEYNANGWLTSSVNEDGAAASFTYNNNGQILNITDALGGVTRYDYDALGRTTSVTDALGGSLSYAYDANGNLLSITNALGGVTTYTYDKLNRVTSTTDALSGVTLVEYDANGNVTKVTNADGGVTTYTYDLLDRLTSYTDTESYTFSFTYDANGNTLTGKDGRGNTSSRVFDALNRAVSQIDEAGGESTVEYDADGRVVKAVNPEGAVTLYEYDRNGNIVRIIDAYNNATTLTYDSMNRVASMTDALGAVTRYTYTAIGEVATITDALGGVRTYVYDLLGRLVKETDELGRSTEYTYDALGRALSVKNPLGHSDTFTYDALGRITTVTDKNGNVTKYIYDANGNIIETIDAMGHSAYFAYDAMNRLIKVTLNRTDAKYGVETRQMPGYQYDKKGNITGVTMKDIDIPTVESTYSETQITLYTYDHRGLVTKEINAAGNETLYIYDGNGNLIQKTDADGYVTEFAYDPRNLVDAINYADGKEVLFAYNANGELVAMMDWNGVTSFELDLLGRITAVNDHKGDKTAYTYDAVSNQTSMTYPDGTVAKYQYDLLGRMTTLTDAENQNTVYAYDAASQLISQAYPNSWTETYAYDAAGQLLRQYAEHPDEKTNHSIEHLYTYDPQGNILTESRSGAGGQARYNLEHTYDALNRMTSTTGDQGYKNQAYTYDSLGNLVHEQDHNKGTEYKYNKLNQQIQKIEDGKDTYNYSFDKRGNLIKCIYEKKNEIVEQYTYDATNRMVLGINADGEESHYIFNGLGYLVANEWIIANNAYGYHGFAYDPTEQVQGVVVCDAHKNTSGQGHQNPTGAGHFKDKGKTNDGERTTGGTSGGILPKGSNKVMSVHKDYTLDYTSPLKDVILETEHGSGGLTYRYTYGLQKVSTVISNVPNGAGELLQNGTVKLYYHHDRLGSTDFLTDNVKAKVTSYVEYDSWGALLSKAIVRLNQRELDLVQEYTGHPYDQVLGLYFAEARMYDAVDRRFAAMDALPGHQFLPTSYQKYGYVLNNPLKYVDLNGLVATPPAPEPGPPPMEPNGSDTRDGGQPVLTASYGIYSAGTPIEPDYSHWATDDFIYDKNVKPTDDDTQKWKEFGDLLWNASLYNGLSYLGRLAAIKIAEIAGLKSEAEMMKKRLDVDLTDALQLYTHYRSALGTDKTINLKKAYDEDGNIKKFIDKEIENLKTAVENMYYQVLTCKFSITGKLVSITERGLYPELENWQKALGDFLIWLSADADYNVKKKKMNLKVTIHSIDYYNFNKGMSDIVTGLPDDSNGRFVVLGWAKPFVTKGEFKKNISWVMK